MFTVKMITNKDIADGEQVMLKGAIVYEEDFNNLKQIDTSDFLGEDTTVKIINNENDSILIIDC